MAARSSLLSIHENEILSLASALAQGKGLSEIARNWRDAVTDYRTKAREVEQNGARVKNLEGDTLVTLLAGALPVASAVAELRGAAERANTSDARESPWFRSLGEPSQATVASLLIIPQVAHDAEAGATQRRYENAVEKFGFPSRFLLGAAGGLIGGIITAYVPGFVVYWPIRWIWGETNAITMALIWITACTVFGAFYRWSDPARLVGNARQDHNEVRIKGAFYSISGAVVVAGALALGIPDIRYVYQRHPYADPASFFFTRALGLGGGCSSSFERIGNDSRGTFRFCPGETESLYLRGGSMPSVWPNSEWQQLFPNRQVRLYDTVTFCNDIPRDEQQRIVQNYDFIICPKHSVVGGIYWSLIANGRGTSASTHSNGIVLDVATY
jgi:hypothetical protein